MSAIFGLIHLDDSPVSPQDLSAMRAAMAEWGSDAGGTWLDGTAGLGCLIRFDTPESRYEDLPMHSERGFALTAEARLDNCPELAVELGLLQSEVQPPSDGTLIHRAYEKWGAQAPRHLIGDWSFAAWHPEEKRLFLARDHFGNTALYYYSDGRRFAFASSRNALHALGLPRRLNEFYLACVLTSWSAHHGSQTIELDLHRLPPAHTLELVAGSFQIDEYWRLQDVAPLQLSASAEYAEAFLPIYDRAVRDRLRADRGLGVMLSGGLDSGSVTSLAARALLARGGRLKAYTSAPIRDVTHTVDGNRFGDEVPFARAVASSLGNVDLVEIRSLEITPIQGIRRALQIHHEPSHASSNTYWIIDVLSTAARDGVGCMLTGQGGNATISWTGMPFSRRTRRLIAVRRWKAAIQRLAYPHLPVSWIRAMRHRLHDHSIDWTHTAILPDFALRIRLAEQYIEGTGTTTNPEEWHSPLQQRYATIMPGRSFGGAIWAEYGAAHGLEVRDPTFDKRVMEFVLAVPEREFSGPNGSDRWLIRSAMNGLMPDQVRLSARRGRQAADLGFRLLRAATEVEAALDEIAASHLAREYLGLERMRSVWKALQQDVNAVTTHQAVTILTRGIMAGLFLKQFESPGS